MDLIPPLDTEGAANPPKQTLKEAAAAAQAGTSTRPQRPADTEPEPVSGDDPAPVAGTTVDPADAAAAGADVSEAPSAAPLPAVGTGAGRRGQR